MTTDQKLTM